MVQKRVIRGINNALFLGLGFREGLGFNTLTRFAAICEPLGYLTGGSMFLCKHASLPMLDEKMVYRRAGARI
jgi:hypothetical protein